MKPNTLVILDAHALIHRAFHAMPGFTSPKGEPMGAVYGVALVLLKLIRELKPTHMAAAFDLPSPTFRHEAYKEYKAQRAEAPDELIAQFARARELVSAFGIPTLDKEGFEADDIIGALKERFKKEKNLKIIIVSGDLDVLQLVEGDRVTVYTMKKSLKDTVTYNEKAVRERFGFDPKYLPDFKGLKGDPSDNIIGVKGIGEKTASQLIQKFSTLEKLYQALKKNKKLAGISERQKTILLEQEEEALFSRELARIRVEMPLEKSFDDLRWNGIPFDEVGLLFRKFHFPSLMERLEGMKGSNPPNPPYSKGGDVLNNLPLKVIENLHLAQWLLDSEQRQANLFSADTDKEDLLKRLKEERLYDWYRAVELPLAEILTRMTARGILIDRAQLERTQKILRKEQQGLEKKIHTQAGEQFNINSPVELRRILFEKFGLSAKGIRKTPGGEISTQWSELAKLRHRHPMVTDVMRHREIAKLLSTYVEPFARSFPHDGVVHSTFNQTATVTGRLSSSNPNMQNLPIKGDFASDIRTMFRARDGFLFAAFDYSQFELRIAAHLAQDKKMIAAFQNGSDIHRQTAAAIFHVAPEAVTPQMRRQAKTINFGILYGMGASALAEQLEVSREEARAFLDEYFNQFEDLTRYRQEALAQARKRGWVATMVGRKRHLPTLNSSLAFVRAEAERMAINAPIQGSQADMIKKAMIDIDRALRLADSNDIYLLLQIHDELVFEIKKEKVKEIVPRIKELMEQVEKLSVPLVVDVRVGPSLGELR
jgi:DNA polymerase-1